MLRDICAAFPAGWGGILAASEINDNTGISLALFVAGIGASLMFAWWVRGERDKDREEIRKLRTECTSMKAEIKGLYIDVKALSAKRETKP